MGKRPFSVSQKEADDLEMHVIFVNYHDFQGPSGIHIFHLANALFDINITSTVLVPDNTETVHGFGEPRFKVMSFKDADNNFQENNRADIIHGWTPRETTRWMTERLSRRYGIPYIVHIEDNEQVIIDSINTITKIGMIWKRIRYPFNANPEPLPHPKKYREFISRASGATLLIEKLEKFIPTHIPKKVIWPACEEEIFSMTSTPDKALRQRLGIPHQDIVITYPGNVHTANVQDVQDLYETIRIARNRGLKVSLIRVGKNHIRFSANFSSLMNKYIFELGDIPSKQIPDFIRAADILIQPGKLNPFNEYRFPSKLPMFLASGRPVILSNVNIAHYLKHEYNAIILDHSNPVEMAGAIEKLVNSPEKRAQIGRAGREFARDNFSWTKTAKSVASFYNLVLKKSKI